VPRNQEKYRENSARGNHDDLCFHSAESIPPKLLATIAHGSSAKHNSGSTTSTSAIILATFAIVLSSVSGNSDYSANTTNSRNFATTTRKFIKARIEFKKPQSESISFFRNYHAHHGRLSHGVRNQEAEKQLFQVYEHSYQ
jgi:hypothetical protein